MAITGRGDWPFISTWLSTAKPWNAQTAAAAGPDQAVWTSWFLEAGGAQQFTLVAGAGAYPYTGAAVALRASRRLGAGEGSYGYSGTALGLLRQARIAVDSGSYAYTGSAVGLFKQFRLITEGTNYSYTGSDVEFVFEASGYTLVVDPGSYAYEGSPVTFRLVKVLAVEGGVYEYTGTDAQLRASRRLVASSGTYLWTGKVVNLRHAYILPVAGTSYMYAGSDVSFQSFAALTQSRTYRVFPQAPRLSRSILKIRDAVLPRNHSRIIQVLSTGSRRAVEVVESRRRLALTASYIHKMEDIMLSMPPKHPDEKLDYSIDYSLLLETGETISSSQWAVPAGITQDTPSPSHTTTSTTIWLSGGTDAQKYRVENTITTSASRIFVRPIEIRVTLDE